MLGLSRRVLATLSLFCFVEETLGKNIRPRSREVVGFQSSEQPTCVAGKVNYITERLPQQCLRSPWSSPGNGAASTELPSSNSDTSRVSSELHGEIIGIATILTTISYIENSIQTPLSHVSIVDPSIRSTDLLTSSTQSSVVAEPTHISDAAGGGESDADGDSPLDKANFLSFDDWKKQNLAKAGQLPEHVGGRASVGNDGNRRRPGNINNALDSLGEDTELELDFGGFVNPGAITQSPPSTVAQRDLEAPGFNNKHDQDSPKTHPRSKDAGKTCKERSNYASFDCAATIMKTNRESKGSTSILVENKDNYMLNECSAKNKFFITELCDDILIDTVVLANFEFFSSSFRTFRVSVSDRYPVKPDKWRDLGTFEARNTREVQAFLIETPQIWARYLRIEFLSHYGNEYYCPVSLLRVHGTTMMEEFNHDLKASRGEYDAENDVEDLDEESGKAQDVVTAVNFNGKASNVPEPTIFAVASNHVSESSPLPQSNAEADGGGEANGGDVLASQMTAIETLSRTKMGWILMANHTHDTICLPHETSEEPSAKSSETVTSNIQENVHTMKLEASEQNANLPSSPSLPVTGGHSPQTVPSSPPPKTGSIGNVDSLLALQHTSQGLQNDTRGPSSYTSSNTAPSATQPHASNPTTQESFFKSVHKRLQLLEANSTLSLQYIEEQSRILRDAFAKVERRQLAKTSAFLETLNTTVLSEMREFRSQYDQLWQSTVLELSSQRVQNQKEIVALSTRLSLLADEVVLQRRIAIMQFLLILVCLGLVLFGRSSSPVATYLELPPMVQNAINRSSANLSRYTPPYDSPDRTPSPTRPSSRYGLFTRKVSTHSRNSSDDSRVTPTVENGMLAPG